MRFASRHLASLIWGGGVILLLVLRVGFSDDTKPTYPTVEAASVATFPKADAVRVSLPEARRQAELLHSTLHATLQLVHHRYYREDEGLPIPAAVVDEIFDEIEAEQSVQLRWLAIEGQAMNTDHKPRDAYEREAAAAIKSGKTSYEMTASGVYRRTGIITLTNHCLKCHVPDRKSTESRKAGLIISIPVLPAGPSSPETQNSATP
ncbi:MAG: DUF3365 domain-containing protein [Planctomycetaceae bacterium]